jgi:hypothetical protein
MTFTDWTIDQFETMAAKYRMQLTWITSTVKSYGGTLSKEQRTMVCGLLEKVPRPVIEKYQGEVTDEEREWYKQTNKPDFARMLQEAKDEL